MNQKYNLMPFQSFAYGMPALPNLQFERKLDLELIMANGSRALMPVKLSIRPEGAEFYWRGTNNPYYCLTMLVESEIQNLSLKIRHDIPAVSTNFATFLPGVISLTENSKAQFLAQVDQAFSAMRPYFEELERAKMPVVPVTCFIKLRGNKYPFHVRVDTDFPVRQYIDGMLLTLFEGNACGSVNDFKLVMYGCLASNSFQFDVADPAYIKIMIACYLNVRPESVSEKEARSVRAQIQALSSAFHVQAIEVKKLVDQIQPLKAA